MSAGRALIRRELAVMAPWVACFAGAACSRVIDDAFLDDRAPAALLGLDDPGLDRLLLWSIWFLIGAHVGTHDVRHGTRAFLETLPVSATARFLARAIVGGVVVAGVAALGELATVVQILRDATRFADVAVLPALGVVAVTIVMTAIRDFAAFALGLFLSPLRQVTWLLAFLGVIGGVFLGNRFPEWQGLTPLHAGVFSEVAGGAVVAREGIALSIAIAAVALVLAVLLVTWRRQPEPRHRRHLGLLAAIGTVAVLGQLEGLAAPAVGDAPQIVESSRFIIGLPPGAGVSPEELATWDADLEAVERRLDHTLDGRLRVDATGTLENAHGKAHGRAIALTQSALHDRFVVVHEMTHAVASSIAEQDGTIPDGFSIFTEGLSNHVARRLAKTTQMDEHSAPMQRLVALAREGRLDDHLFWDASAAREVGGNLLVYAVGEIFVDAMVEVYGEDAPGRMLRALAVVPQRGRRGLAAWHEVLARAGMMFEPIRARALARVIAARDATPPDTLPPRPLVAVDLEVGTLVIRALDQRGAVVTGDVRCTVRNHPREPTHSFVHACRVPRRLLAGRTAEVRVSIGENVHSTWTRVALPPR